MTKIFLAADHRGFKLKEEIKTYLIEKGFEVEDCGPFSFNPDDDYPVFIAKAVKKVSENSDKAKAIIFGKSGQGEAMAANRFKGIRAAVYYGRNLEILNLSRKDNNANVLSLAAGFLSFKEAKEAVELWLNISFGFEPRHTRRIKQIDSFNADYG